MKRRLLFGALLFIFTTGLAFVANDAAKDHPRIMKPGNETLVVVGEGNNINGMVVVNKPIWDITEQDKARIGKFVVREHPDTEWLLDPNGKPFWEESMTEDTSTAKTVRKSCPAGCTSLTCCDILGCSGPARDCIQIVGPRPQSKE